MKGRKGELVLMNWVIAAGIVFGLVLIQLMVIPPLESVLSPALLSFNPEFASQHAFVINMWDIVFYILYFVIFVFMVVQSFRREELDAFV